MGWLTPLSLCIASGMLLLVWPYVFNVEGPDQLALLIPLSMAAVVHLLAWPLSLLMSLRQQSRVGLLTTGLYGVAVIAWAVLSSVIE